MGFGGVLRGLFLSFIDHTIMKSVDNHLSQLEKHFMLRRYNKDVPPQLVQCKYQDFYFETDGKPVIVVGADSYAPAFIRASKNVRRIKKVIANYPCQIKVDNSIVNVGTFDDVTDEEKESCVFVIASCWYFRDYCNLLIENGIERFYAVPTYNYNNKKRKMEFYGGILKWRQDLPYYLSFSEQSYWTNCVKFSVDSALRTLHIGGKYQKYKKLQRYKNIHKGERCFILATGPSLTLEDAETLKNEFTFGVNSIYKMFDDTDWRPTYYVMSDCMVYEKTILAQKDFTFDSLSIEQSFIPDAIEAKMTNPCDMNKVSVFPISYLNHLGSCVYSQLKYSANPVKGLYNLMTVTNTCVNLAQYMGFSEIYLLGVDFNYSSNMDKQHFDGSHNVDMDNNHIRQSMVFNTARAYKLVRKETEKAGIKVYNATRGGKLEIFERVDFDSLKLK